MATETCDIAFYLPSCTVVNETSPGAANGSITVFASGVTGSTKKYNIVPVGTNSDFDYATQGQTSGTFSNLVAGTYTVSARSSSSCMAAMPMTVGRDSSYSIRFTNQYYSLGPSNTRARWKFDILKRDYTGLSYNVPGRAFVTWGEQGSEDPFQTIVPSRCTLELTSRTDEEFLELYTTDEREFIVKLYKHNGSDWVLWWQGYILTGQYVAPYNLKTNYTVTIIAADMLENLKEIPFGNADGTFPLTRITIMEGILLALQRTDIELDVYEGIQLLITGVDTLWDETTAVELAYFDPAVYNQGDEPESCYEVLDSLLRCMWSRIYQGDGRWNIESITLKSGGEFNVRTRDFFGDQTGAGYTATSPRLAVRKASVPGPRLVFAEQTQMMKIAETYGSVTVVYNYSLEDENNILVKSDFVDIDIDNGQLDGWAIDDSTATLITSEIVTTTDGGESYSSLKFTSSGGGITYTETVVVTSDAVELADPGVNYTMRVSFEVFMEPYDPTVYTYFDYAVGMFDTDLPGDVYVLSTVDTDTGHRGIGAPGAGELISSKWNRVYVDNANAWTKVSFDTTVEQSGGFQSGDLQVSFRFGMNPTYDHVSQAALQAETTLNIISIQTFDNRRRVKGEGGQTGFILFYELEAGTAATSYPDVVRPTDYGGSNTFVWNLKRKIFDINVTPIFRETWFNAGTIRNVVVQYLPLGQQPEATGTTASVVNTNTKHNLDVNLRHGNMPEDSENYRNITKSWLSFSSGTAISTWTPRNGGIGGGPQTSLQTQVATAYRGQYNARRWKLSGTWDTQQVVPSFFNTFLEVRTGKVYLPTYLMVDTKDAKSDVEMIEVLAGAPITDTGIINPASPPVPIEPPPPEADRIHVDAFADAFI